MEKMQKKEKVGITLTKETYESLKKQCKELGLTKSQLISLLINQSGKEK